MYVYVCMQCALKVIPTMEQAYLSIKKIFLLHCRIAALLLLVQLPVLSAYLAWPNNCLLTMFLFFAFVFAIQPQMPPTYLLHEVTYSA